MLYLTLIVVGFAFSFLVARMQFFLRWFHYFLLSCSFLFFVKFGLVLLPYYFFNFPAVCCCVCVCVCFLLWCLFLYVSFVRDHFDFVLFANSVLFF